MKRTIVFISIVVLIVATLFLAQSLTRSSIDPKLSGKRIMDSVRGTSHDTSVLQIDGKTYDTRRKEIENVLAGAWESVYLPAQELLLVSRIETGTAEDQKIAEGKSLEDALRKLLGDGFKSLVWGVLLQKGGDTLLFPTGRIYVLFEEKLSMVDRKKALAAFPDLEIQFFNDEKAKMPVNERSFVHGKEYIPDYARSAIERGIKPPPAVSIQKGGVVPRPFAVLRLPVGQEHQTFMLADTIAGLPGIRLSTPDFHVLGKKIVGLTTNNPPPIPGSDTFIARAQIDRAWSLFYPMSYMGSALFPDRFMCSDKLTAVFDGNFHDHNSLRQFFIGYDAADNDQDPRSPIHPPGTTIVDPEYVHGLYMSGVIGGHEQSTGDKCGVAPGTFIVPFRAVAIYNIDLSTREGTDQFVSEYAEDVWNALHRLYLLSYSEHLTVANFSGTWNPVVFAATNMDAWMDWFLAEGNWGHGIFFAASAGNNSASSTITFPARKPSVFAVAWGDYQNNQALGNHGPGVDVTVDDGRYPEYSPIGPVYIAGSGSGGSSVSSAVVSGVATMMRMAGSTAIDNRDQLSSILRFSTRFSDTMLPDVNTDGVHPDYGHGFLDAYHAVKIAYKDRLKPMRAAKIKYTASEPSMLLINAGFRPDSAFPGRPTGVFWNLKQMTDGTGTYWGHVRYNENSRHCETLIDPISPMGGFVVGDYDGDGLDELVFQLGYWADNPEFYLIARKFDPTVNRWSGMGRYAPTSFPNVQYVLPQDFSVKQLFAARLEDSNRDNIVSVQGDVLNAAKYDGTSDIWKSISPANYAPRLVSQSVNQSLREGWFDRLYSYGYHLERVEPFNMFEGKQALLVISRVEKEPPFLFFWQNPEQYIIASFLLYNQSTHLFENIPIGPLGETHRMVQIYEGPPKPFIILADDFDGDGNLEAVMNTHNIMNGLCLIDTSPTLSFISTRCSSHPEVPWIVRSGDVDGNGKAELAFISGFANDNKAAFLSWDASSGVWTQSLPLLSHNRKNNRAKDILVGDFNSDGIAEVGLLLEKPHGNIYAVYQMDGGQFMEYGLW